jgi:hypothetical protein
MPVYIYIMMSLKTKEPEDERYTFVMKAVYGLATPPYAFMA